MIYGCGLPPPLTEAEDEYEHSFRSSPAIVTDSEASPTESEGLTIHDYTSSSFASHLPGERLTDSNITEWTADECADFVGSLGLRQYSAQFIENEIVGEALVALHHDELKQMGVTSVGHRLTILKGVYDIKMSQDIPLDNDHYVPLSADAEGQNAYATLKDIKQILEQLRLRDERMTAAESELRKITIEFEHLKEELLPVFRIVKEGKPLPQPSQNLNCLTPSNYDISNTLSPPTSSSSSQTGVGLSRNLSTKNFVLDQSKLLSPTYTSSVQERSASEKPIDPSLSFDRSLQTSSHPSYLNNNGGGTSGHLSPNQQSPTSPMSVSNIQFRSHRSDQQAPARTNLTLNDSDQYQSSGQCHESSKSPPLRRAQTSSTDNSSSGGSVEIFKSFRVSMDDPCYKVLPTALKKYNINAPWEQYALYIVYGGNERCLEMDEKPLILFKQLDKEGKKPMFMLRKIAPGVDKTRDAGCAAVDRSLARQQSGGYNDPPGGII